EAGQRGPVVATVLFAVAVAVASAAAVADAVADDDMAGVRSGRLPGAGDQGPVVGAAGAVDSGATADPADPGDAGGEDDPGPGGGEHVGQLSGPVVGEQGVEDGRNGEGGEVADDGLVGVGQLH